MSQIDQRYCYIHTENFAEGSDLEFQVRLLSPYPEMTMVMISDSHLFRDRFVPLRMVRIANQTVRAFNLNPSQVVWIEHVLSRYDSPSCAVFHLINFDWQAGHATSPHRSPIYEDWYLSWLEAELYPSEPRQ